MRQSHRLHRLIGYLVIVIILFFTTKAPSSLSRSLRWSQSEETVEIIIKKAEYIPYQDEYEKLLYPTVRITAGFATGSGVIINHKDTKDTKNTIYILTACHVVDNQSVVSVEVYPSKIKIDADVVITDTDKDLALIKIRISSTLQHFYSASLAPKNYQPYLFHHIYTIGCSLGLPPRPSEGIISAITLSQPSPLEGEEKGEGGYWEVSSPILPGNSGGPVYDASTFDVIGIAVWVRVHNRQLITTMAGIVPINQIYDFLNKSSANFYATGGARK